MIQPVGQDVLGTLGLADRLKARSAPINRLHGVAASGRVALNVNYGGLRGMPRVGWGVHRGALFSTLHEAVAREGIAVETGRIVRDAPVASGDKRRLAFADGGQTAPFDLTIDALGANSSLSPKQAEPLAYGALWASLAFPADAPFPRDALSQRYRQASVMVGVMPMGRPEDAGSEQCAFFWSLRRDRFEAWTAAPLESWKDQVRSLWPETEALLDQIRSRDQLTFATYVHRTNSPVAGRGLVRLGNSWRAASPQLGQGANMALVDAQALSSALAEAPDVPSALARYQDARRTHVAVYQALSYVFTPFYQSDSVVLPWLRDFALPVLTATPPARRLLAAMVAGSMVAPIR